MNKMSSVSGEMTSYCKHCNILPKKKGIVVLNKPKEATLRRLVDFLSD